VKRFLAREKLLFELCERILYSKKLLFKFSVANQT